MTTYRWAARSTTPGDWRWTAAAVAQLAFPTTSSAVAGRVQQICDALVSLLATADTAGAFAQTLGTARAYTTNLTLEAPVGTLDVLAVPAFTQRRRTSNGTYRRDVVVEILVRTHLDADATIDQATTDAGMYLIEQIDDYLADPDHGTLTLPDGVLAIYVEPTDMRAETDVRADAGAMWLKDHLVNLRQVTGLVRVAYCVDVSY